MHPVELETALDTMVITVDTREQDTPQARKRYSAFGVPFERSKLDFGDYSARFTVNGEAFSLEHLVAVERKMSADELAMCFTSQRKRFTKEFERAASEGAKLYLLVEDCTWDKLYRGDYRSRMTPQAFIASITAFTARYNCVPIFCPKAHSGKLIAEILRREGKEKLKGVGE